MQIENEFSPTWDYTDATVQAAINQISDFEAEMGGTMISAPLSVAVDTLSKEQKETRIFLLTDGCADDRDEVIAKSLTGNDSI